MASGVRRKPTNFSRTTVVVVTKELSDTPTRERVNPCSMWRFGYKRMQNPDIFNTRYNKMRAYILLCSLKSFRSDERNFRAQARLVRPRLLYSVDDICREDGGRGSEKINLFLSFNFQQIFFFSKTLLIFHRLSPSRGYETCSTPPTPPTTALSGRDECIGGDNSSGSSACCGGPSS